MPDKVANERRHPPPSERRATEQTRISSDGRGLHYFRVYSHGPNGLPLSSNVHFTKIHGQFFSFLFFFYRSRVAFVQRLRGSGFVRAQDVSCSAANTKCTHRPKSARGYRRSSRFEVDDVHRLVPLPNSIESTKNSVPFDIIA